jgi:hypothetical protein
MAPCLNLATIALHWVRVYYEIIRSAFENVRRPTYLVLAIVIPFVNFYAATLGCVLASKQFDRHCDDQRSSPGAPTLSSELLSSQLQENRFRSEVLTSKRLCTVSFGCFLSFAFQRALRERLKGCVLCYSVSSMQRNSVNVPDKERKQREPANGTCKTRS